MLIRSTRYTRIKGSGRRLCRLLPAALAAVLISCASTETVRREPTPRQDFIEYRQYDLLILRNWEILPPDADRTKLPGFIAKWPVGEDFETLNTAYMTKYPDQPAGSDDVSLMVVWISLRLPYQKEEANTQPETNGT